MSIQNAKEEAVFYHYILDPKRKLREKKYYTVYLALGIAFMLFILSMYSNFPVDTVGSVPVVAIYCWVILILHYIVMMILGGMWLLDMKTESKLEKEAPDSVMNSKN